MANFTINSLTASHATASDQFIKSDANGALTRVSVQDLANDLLGLAGLPVVVRTANLTFGSTTVPTTFYKLGRIVLINIQGAYQVEDATIDLWTPVGTVPDGIGSFTDCGIIVPKGYQVILRNNNGTIQLQTQQAMFWPQGSGVGLATT